MGHVWRVMSETSSPPRPCAIGPGVQPGAAPGAVGKPRDKFSVGRLLSFRGLALPGAGFDSRRLHQFPQLDQIIETELRPCENPQPQLETPSDPGRCACGRGVRDECSTEFVP